MSICILPKLGGLGGPASFAARLTAALAERDVEAHSDVSRSDIQVVLVMGGTRQVGALFQLKRRGVRIVQRLNGMNWIHRRANTGIKHFLRSEFNNLLLAGIRRTSDRIIYQSRFSRDWWQTVYGSTPAHGTVIYNGIDLQKVTPTGVGEKPVDRYRILLVEGHLGGGNEPGLMNAVALCQQLKGKLDKPVELMVAGDVPGTLQKTVAASGINVVWRGIVARDEVPALDRSAHILFSADLNAACPNSVIEALACGLPVVAFATGALPEMLAGDAGKTAPYGTDYWRLQAPDIAGLADAAMTVLADLPRYQRGARQQAEALFDIQHVTTAYLDVLLG